MHEFLLESAETFVVLLLAALFVVHVVESDETQTVFVISEWKTLVVDGHDDGVEHRPAQDGDEDEFEE